MGLDGVIGSSTLTQNGIFTTDSQGEIRITNLAPGAYVLSYTYGIGKDRSNGRRYFYLDYEPQPGIRWTGPPRDKSGTYTDIVAWIWQEYGLKVRLQQIAQIRHKHGIVAKKGRSRLRPDESDPVKVPLDAEAAIEAALRHFGILPDEN